MPLSLVAEAATEWLRFWDAGEQQHYYFHPATEETAWVLPSEATFHDGDEESAVLAGGKLYVAPPVSLSPCSLLCASIPCVNLQLCCGRAARRSLLVFFLLVPSARTDCPFAHV